MNSLIFHRCFKTSLFGDDEWSSWKTFGCFYRIRTRSNLNICSQIKNDRNYHYGLYQELANNFGSVLAGFRGTRFSHSI